MRLLVLFEHLLIFRQPRCLNLQLRLFQCATASTKFFHYYVLKDLNNNFIGLGYGEKFNINDKSCIWGVRVLSNLKKTDKFGSIILYLLFNRLFSLKEINKINCQVLKEFDWIKEWYIRWGHEIENFDEINGCFNLHLFKNKWNSIKNEMLKNL